MEEDYKEIILGELKKLFGDRCNRILIVNPPQIPKEDFDISIAKLQNYPCFPPYGPALICKNLYDSRYGNDIIDLNYEVLREANTNPNFDYDSWKKLLGAKIDEFNPDAVGISCMFSMTHKSMREVADFIKNKYPEMPIIAGGVHTSTTAKSVLEDCKSIDVISLYESDVSFIQMLDIINGRKTNEQLTQVAMIVNGTYFEVPDRVVTSEEVISKTPLYHNLDIGNYSQYGRIGAEARLMLPEGTKISTVLSNRGCRGNCIFCSVNNFNGKGVRQRSVESVANEIETLKTKYGIGHIMWLDDDLLFNKTRALLLFNELIKRNLEITWDASNGLVASSIDKDIMDAASKSGCIYLNLGIESGSPEILKSTRKPSGIKQFLKASEVLSNYPEIFSRGFLMMGFPNETIGQVKKTIELSREMSLDWCSLQLLMVLPSTELAKEMIQKGELDEKKFTDGTTRCFVGSTGGQRIKEQKEKLNSNFENLLQREDNYCPNTNELKDLWFLADYYINYDRIPQENNPIKLIIKEKMLKEICERKTKENALACLFLSIVMNKLGKSEEAQKYLDLSKEYLYSSAFWKTRFETLGLFKLLEDTHISKLT